MKNRTNVRWLTQLALLVAILLVLNYTPLGYLQIGPLSASLLTVPVAIGAMTMNPMAGAILGGVFGATSFIQAVEGKSAMGAALFQVSPAGTFVVCFVARVLMGLCTALIFNALRKAMPKNEKLACFLGGLSAPVLNTVFFMGFLVLIFYNCDYVQNLANTLGAQNAFMFIVLLVGVQAIFEWVICCVVAGAVSLPVRKYLKIEIKKIRWDRMSHRYFLYKRGKVGGKARLSSLRRCGATSLAEGGKGPWPPLRGGCRPQATGGESLSKDAVFLYTAP